ncbi:MAG TPA: type II toxin-antitoxin system prevent-host-death family antitoxin [Dehalococcoidia bacterium]|jgi:prevent-host-death family protein|nr:type II toxin-antitoxin system prevent-host-death family antitoxin [Dehalococcoidia bacterium]
MERRVSLAEAKAKFSALVDDVRRTSRRYLIERHGRPAAAVVSVEDLAKLESDALGPAPAGALALVGVWSDVEDEAIDEFLDDVLRSRAEDTGRPVGLET